MRILPSPRSWWRYSGIGCRRAGAPSCLATPVGQPRPVGWRRAACRPGRPRDRPPAARSAGPRRGPIAGRPLDRCASRLRTKLRDESRCPKIGWPAGFCQLCRQLARGNVGEPGQKMLVPLAEQEAQWRGPDRLVLARRAVAHQRIQQCRTVRVLSSFNQRPGLRRLIVEVGAIEAMRHGQCRCPSRRRQPRPPPGSAPRRASAAAAAVPAASQQARAHHSGRAASNARSRPSNARKASRLSGSNPSRRCSVAALMILCSDARWSASRSTASRKASPQDPVPRLQDRRTTCRPVAALPVKIEALRSRAGGGPRAPGFGRVRVPMVMVRKNGRP